MNKIKEKILGKSNYNYKTKSENPLLIFVNTLLNNKYRKILNGFMTIRNFIFP